MNYDYLVNRDALINKNLYVLVTNTFNCLFFGYLESYFGQTVVLRKARKIKVLDAGYDKFTLATEGFNDPEKCASTVEVDSLAILNALYIYSITEKAKKTFEKIPELR